MNLPRAIGRVLLGSFFIATGVKALKDPAPFVPAAEPLAAKLVPFAQKVLPSQVSAYVPEDTATLVRLNAAASLVGGLGVATGIGRRPAAALAAASLVPSLLATRPRTAVPDDRDDVRAVFWRDLALLGAALVVSQDTAGRPSLAWRARDQRRRLARETEHRKELLAKDSKRLKREAKLQARLARKHIEGALS